MRYRISNTYIGLGNPNQCLLPNKWTDNKELNSIIQLMFGEALKLERIKDYEGFDFNIEEDGISFGLEPSYQYDKLIIYHINKDKSKCYVKEGIAKGYYGSEIEVKGKRGYNNVDLDFKNLIDKWYDKIFN